MCGGAGGDRRLSGNGSQQLCLSLLPVQRIGDSGNRSEDRTHGVFRLYPPDEVSIPDAVTQVGWSICRARRGWNSRRWICGGRRRRSAVVQRNNYRGDGSGQRRMIAGFYAFCRNTVITAVTVPATVGTVDAFSFSGCKALQTVTLAEGVQSVGAYAFHWCTSLREISCQTACRRSATTLSPCKSLKHVRLSRRNRMWLPHSPAANPCNM